ARSLGYVVGVNEYYTSKRCPKCEGFVAQTESIRRLDCPQCQRFMHRDVMAGHNICRVMRGHIEKGERPDYLQPFENDGNYPWKPKQQPSPEAGPSRKRPEDKTEEMPGGSTKKRRPD
ncbi:hypothetical protein BGW38_008603, partial [Lunasporangiospora selenospora]